MMPVLSGEQLVYKMRSEPELAQIPVMVLSAKSDDELRVKLLSGSIQDYLIKPFSAQELRARVSNMVSVKLARDALQDELSDQNQDLSQLASKLIYSRRELQHSHVALKASQARCKAVYNNSAAGIALTNASGKILTANPAFQRITGYSESELRELNIEDLTAEDERAPMRDRLDKLVRRGGSEYRVERRYIGKEGKTVWANASVSLIPAWDDNPAVVVQIIDDITEKKMAQEALDQLQQEMVHVSRSATLGELAAYIAHEVNQPLSAIMTNAHAGGRWLKTNPPNLAEIEDGLKRIVRDSDRAAGIIRMVRSFIKKKEPRKEPLNFKTLLHEIELILSPQLRLHHINFEIKVADDLPLVLGDAVQIQQLLINLSVNAIEAMSSAGLTNRHLSLVAKPNETVEGVILSVRDSGPGIEEEQLDKLFEAFFTTKQEGLGMGLAICRTIAEAHEGRIWVENNADWAGASFHVEIIGNAGDKA